MGENLKVRTIVVLLLVAASAWILGKPWFIDHKSPMTLGLDIRGGVNLRYEFDPKDLPPGQSLSDAVEQAKQIFEHRLDSLAVKELSIRSIGDSQIEVAVPGISSVEAEAIQQTLESIGRLELRLEAWTEAGVTPDSLREELTAEIKRRNDAGETLDVRTEFSALTQNVRLVGSGVTYRWVPKSEKMLRDEIAQRVRRRQAAALTDPSWDVVEAWVLVRYDPREGQSFTGGEIASVYAAPDAESGQQAVGFEIKPGIDSQRFADWTEKNKNHSIVTILDNQVQSIANIESRIEGNGIIRGGSEGFTPDEINRLITVIRSGSLAIKPNLAQKFTQGPSLGEDSIKRGVDALLVSFAIVSLFMLVYYRLNGLVAVVALVCNLMLLAASMSWVGATLTLPGIAGFILTIGIAVDANILINERIREEIEKGKTIAQAVKNGFERAYITIFDSNLTTFISGFFLYQFGTGIIRGFAVTLMIGLATSMLTGVYFSRTFFEWWLRRGVKKMTMMKLFATPNFNFLSKARLCYAISAIVIVGGVGLFLWYPSEKYGMDFTGGFEVQIHLREPAEQPEVASVLSQKFKGPDVVSVDSEGGKARRFQIKIKETDLHEASTTPIDTTARPQAMAERFAGEIAGLFAGKLVDVGMQGLKLDAADENGRVPVTCSLFFDGEVRKSDLEAALKKNLRVDKIEGPDVGSKFDVAGSFAIDPGSQERARALLTPRVSSPDGARTVELSDPLPAKSYVGPRAGAELRDAAIRAMVTSLLGIILYARMRFSQYRYGISAVIALIHDVLVTLASFGIARLCGYKLELDLTVVAAFLTIIGYSINDTIVIFDRIRENLPRTSLPLPDLVNRSVNQTLSRSIFTSTTVFLSMLVLFLFNVGQHNALEGFAFAMLVGLVTGFYSTLFLASARFVHISQVADRRNQQKGPPARPPMVAA